MFDEQAWLNYRDQIYDQYPCPRGKWRFDLTLSFPRAYFEYVPVDRNPHSPHPLLSPHSCYYKCWDWSTIFNVCEFHESEPCLRMIVESGNSDPVWGEKICLLSTSSCIQNEEWGTNPANKFAIFRGRFWKITQSIFLHDGYRELYSIMGNRITYPIRMEPFPFDGRPVFGPGRSFGHSQAFLERHEFQRGLLIAQIAQLQQYEALRMARIAQLQLQQYEALRNNSPIETARQKLRNNQSKIDWKIFGF